MEERTEIEKIIEWNEDTPINKTHRKAAIKGIHFYTCNTNIDDLQRMFRKMLAMKLEIFGGRKKFCYNANHFVLDDVHHLYYGDYKITSSAQETYWFMNYIRDVEDGLKPNKINKDKYNDANAKPLDFKKEKQETDVCNPLYGMSEEEIEELKAANKQKVQERKKNRKLDPKNIQTVDLRSRPKKEIILSEDNKVEKQEPKKEKKLRQGILKKLKIDETPEEDDKTRTVIKNLKGKEKPYKNKMRIV